jgi:formate-dependent nitrite reductase membrane component NrfD
VPEIQADPNVGYYGKNIVKPHIWKPEFIGVYFFLGGLAGGSATLAWTSRLRGDHELARAGFLTAAGGAALSSVLLIADLGRPERFMNMLRMVKVTSPMNVGTWILSAFGGAATIAAACDLAGRRDSFAARAAETVCGIFGMPLAAYTAVLVSTTATPAWYEARFDLPFLFVAGAASSSGAFLSMVVRDEAAGPARRLSFFGGALEYAMHHRMVGRLGKLGEPYRKGEPHAISSIASFCTGIGALLTQTARGSRGLRLTGGVLTLAGALFERLAVLEAGKVSAKDPKYVIEQQTAYAATPQNGTMS